MEGYSILKNAAPPRTLAQARADLAAAKAQADKVAARVQAERVH